MQHATQTQPAQEGESTNLSGVALYRAEYPKLQVGEMTRWGTEKKRSEKRSEKEISGFAEI